MVEAVPSDEEVAARLDEAEGVAESPADGGVEDGHGGAGSAGDLGDGAAGRGDHAVDEGDAGVVEAEVGDGGFVVADAEVFLEDLEEEGGAEEGFAPAICAGVLRVGHAVEVAVGLGGDVIGPAVEGGEGVVDVEVFGAGQAGGAEEVDAGDVDAAEVGGGKGKQVVK